MEKRYREEEALAQMKGIQNYATQCLKQLSEDFQNYFQLNNQHQPVQISKWAQHSQHNHFKFTKSKKVEQHNSQHEEQDKKIRILNKRKVYTTSCHEPTANKQENIDVSPWSFANFHEGYRGSFKQIAHFQQGSGFRPRKISVNQENEHQIYLAKQKIKKVDRSKKNKSTIARYSENVCCYEDENPKSVVDHKYQRKPKTNKQNIHDPYIELVSICKPPQKNKQKPKQLKDNALNNITNINVNSYNKPRQKNQGSKSSLTEVIVQYENKKKQVGEDEESSKYKFKTNHNINLENLYQKYTEMQRKNSTSSCEKIKNEILSNIEKQGLLGFYHAGASVFKSSTNKMLIRYSKKKQKGYCKKSQLQKHSQSLKSHNADLSLKSSSQNQQNSVSLSKYLLQKVKSEKNKKNQAPQTNFLCIQNRKKQQNCKMEANPLSKHLLQKYKIIISKQK